MVMNSTIIRKRRNRRVGFWVIVIWFLIALVFSFSSYAQGLVLKDSMKIDPNLVTKCYPQVYYKTTQYDLNLKTDLEYWRELGISCYQSDTRYATLYKIEYEDRNFYTDFIVIVRKEFLIFSEYKRDGSLRNSYRLPIKKLKVYKSK